MPSGLAAFRVYMLEVLWFGWFFYILRKKHAFKKLNFITLEKDSQ